MRERKPVLLLDVDGVLNSFGPGYEMRKVMVGKGGALHPTRVIKPFMKWAWESFEVFWLTAWFDMANGIADWAKLPHREVLGNRMDSGDFKLNAVMAKFSDYDGKVVWVEDGIGAPAKAWVAAKPNFKYIETSPFEGLTAKQVKEAGDFAGVTTVKWKGKAWK